MNKKIIAYHGSPSVFNKFDTSYINPSGSSDGYGIYFTTSKNNAKMFMEGHGVLYTCELDIRGVLQVDSITIPKHKLTQIVDVIDYNNDGDLLSEYGDVNRLGRKRVLSDCVHILISYSESDAEIFSEIFNIIGDFDIVAKGFIDMGYNCQILNNPKWGIEDHKVIIALNPNDINIIEKETMSEANESYSAKYVLNLTI